MFLYVTNITAPYLFLLRKLMKTYWKEDERYIIFMFVPTICGWQKMKDTQYFINWKDPYIMILYQALFLF